MLARFRKFASIVLAWVRREIRKCLPHVLMH
jgi:hypothetical protein